MADQGQSFTMKDGTVITGVPAGMTQAEVEANYQKSQGGQGGGDTEQPGYVSRLTGQLGIPPLPHSWSEAGREALGMVKSIAMPPMVPNTINLISAAGTAAGNIRRGQPVLPNVEQFGKEAARDVVGNIPIVGPAILTGAEDIRNRNWPGLAGTGTGLAIQGGLALAGAKAPEMGESFAQRAAQSMIGPEPKNIFESVRPAPAMVREAPIAMSRKGLIENLDSRIGDYNQQVRSALARSPATPQALQPIVDRAVQPLADLATRTGNVTQANAITQWANDYINAHGGQLSLTDLKGLQDDLTKSGKVFGRGPEEEPGLKAAKQAVYTEINKTFEQNIPGIRQWTQREGGLIKYRDALADRQRLAEGAPLLPPIHGYLGAEEGVPALSALGMRIRVPEGTLPKTLAIKALGRRAPLPPLP